MELTYILDQLATGELRKDVLGGQREATPGIKPDDYKRLIPAINLAILELHTKLPIRQESITVEQNAAITLYELTWARAQSNTASTETVQYLSDSVFMPFNPRVLSIKHVFDMGGHELPINDDNDLSTVWTPRHNVVQLPYPRADYTMDVVYQSCIPNIPTNITEAEAETYDVDIPEYSVMALLAYALSRLMIGTGLTENGNAEAFALSKFNMACNQIKNEGLIPPLVRTNTQVSTDGWR